MISSMILVAKSIGKNTSKLTVSLHLLLQNLSKKRDGLDPLENHLLLVPTYVRRRDLNANIGFFMHCPFPSSDIYKCSLIEVRYLSPSYFVTR
jgi:hypothetical protein